MDVSLHHGGEGMGSRGTYITITGMEGKRDRRNRRGRRREISLAIFYFCFSIWVPSQYGQCRSHSEQVPLCSETSLAMGKHPHRCTKTCPLLVPWASLEPIWLSQGQSWISIWYLSWMWQSTLIYQYQYLRLRQEDGGFQTSVNNSENLSTSFKEGRFIYLRTYLSGQRRI